MESDDEWLVPMREQIMDAVYAATDPFLERIPKDEIADEILKAAASFAAMAVVDWDDMPVEEVERIVVENFMASFKKALAAEISCDPFSEDSSHP
jgi:hypothetical protein